MNAKLFSADADLDGSLNAYVLDFKNKRWEDFLTLEMARHRTPSPVQIVARVYEHFAPTELIFWTANEDNWILNKLA